VVWKLDRLGRNLRHLANTVQTLSDRGIGLRVLTGQGAQIDTTTPTGKLIFGIFVSLAEFERELIRERTFAGLSAARRRGRKASADPYRQPWPPDVVACRHRSLRSPICVEVIAQSDRYWHRHPPLLCGGLNPLKSRWIGIIASHRL